MWRSRPTRRAGLPTSIAGTLSPHRGFIRFERRRPWRRRDGRGRKVNIGAGAAISKRRRRSPAALILTGNRSPGEQRHPLWRQHYDNQNHDLCRGQGRRRRKPASPRVHGRRPAISPEHRDPVRVDIAGDTTRRRRRRHDQPDHKADSVGDDDRQRPNDDGRRRDPGSRWRLRSPDDRSHCDRLADRSALRRSSCSARRDSRARRPRRTRARRAPGRRRQSRWTEALRATAPARTRQHGKDRPAATRARAAGSASTTSKMLEDDGHEQRPGEPLRQEQLGRQHGHGRRRRRGQRRRHEAARRALRLGARDRDRPAQSEDLGEHDASAVGSGKTTDAGTVGIGVSVAVNKGQPDEPRDDEQRGDHIEGNRPRGRADARTARTRSRSSTARTGRRSTPASPSPSRPATRPSLPGSPEAAAASLRSGEPGRTSPAARLTVKATGGLRRRRRLHEVEGGTGTCRYPAPAGRRSAASPAAPARRPTRRR